MNDTSNAVLTQNFCHFTINQVDGPERRPQNECMRSWVTSFKKNLSFLALGLLLIACAGKPVSEKPLTIEKNKLAVEKFMLEVGQPYIWYGCYLGKYNGSQKGAPGEFCVFEQNGDTIVYQNGYLKKFDRKFMPLWSSTKHFLHHDLKRSEIDGHELLGMSSVYEENAKKLIRYDKLIVFGKHGQVKKSFNFENYYYQLPRGKKPEASDNGWTTDGFQNKSYELGHINSFSELYKTVASKKVLTGYLANCIANRKIYLLDKNLKKIVRVIETGTRIIHSISQYDEHQLIYYLNFNTEDPLPRYSSVGLFDMTTQKYRTLYANKSVLLSTQACGSVQKLPLNRLFIVNSHCLNKPLLEGQARDYLEFVDLNSGEVLTVAVETKLMLNHAALTNADSYFLNNLGY